ncbi:transporter [Curvibacter sp. HBC61]|uniref:Transporter n=1 Tax=Curvibacter cyanobacteriorum TaxID=3026422 RepID=A0ABT5N484_9BURK|nr:transporter [Curvibacter sp. HBC61]MDD0841075.1 transporter [Curvibacter sp. HBC61]
MVSGLLGTSPALAAEGFQVRYNIAGSLGGEMFAPPDLSGWVVGAALTHIQVNKTSGGDGGDFRTPLPGGTFPLSANAGQPGKNPTFAPSSVQVIGTGSMNMWNLGMAYASTQTTGGGRWVLGLNVPYATLKQNVRNVGTAPPLSWPSQSGASAAVQSGVAQQFGSAYQQELASAAEGQTGELGGVGDVEVLTGWSHRTEQIRTTVGINWVLPTGNYNSPAAFYIGGGNFYTLRPGAQVVYLPVPQVALAGRVSLGLNSRNQSTHVRSGNWAGLELAGGYMTPIGPVGLHWVRVQQYHDDVDNPLGPNRLRLNNAGAFVTTVIPGIQVALTLQYMRTTSSQYAKSGNFTQIRISKEL